MIGATNKPSSRSSDLIAGTAEVHAVSFPSGQAEVGGTLRKKGKKLLIEVGPNCDSHLLIEIKAGSPEIAKQLKNLRSGQYIRVSGEFKGNTGTVDKVAVGKQPAQATQLQRFTGSVIEYPPVQGHPSGAFLILEEPVKLGGKSRNKLQLPGTYSTHGGRLSFEGTATLQVSPAGDEYLRLTDGKEITDTVRKLCGSVMEFPPSKGHPSGAFLRLEEPVVFAGKKYSLVQVPGTYSAGDVRELTIEAKLEARVSPAGDHYLAARFITELASNDPKRERKARRLVDGPVCRTEKAKPAGRAHVEDARLEWRNRPTR